MTTTDIWRDFDPNLELPIGLKNVNVTPTVQEGTVVESPENDVELDPQTESYEDEASDDSDEDIANDILEPPGSFEILSQTVRTAPDGRQVVDIVIEVEDMPGAADYDFRITTV